MRRAAGNVEINWQSRGRTIQNLRIAGEGPASNRAGPDSDDDSWFGHGVPGFLQGQLHVFGNAAGDEQSVGMARRGDELNSETAEIPPDCSQHVVSIKAVCDRVPAMSPVSEVLSR